MTERAILHIDMNNFYASVECMLNPELKYLQSSFEKKFSCGHICICADVNMGAQGKEQRTFTIYGVKDFENTATWMKEFIQLSNDT